MDAKELNALVHDHEAAFYDDRFQIRFGDGIGRAVERDLKRVIGGPSMASRALDVACGTGYLAIGLKRAGIAADVHGCDLSPKMLERCRANAASAGASVTLTLADAERLPYATDSFDLVCARGALHHVPDPAGALREMRRVLTPGGTAIVLAEPTPSGERQVGAVVGVAVRAVEFVRRVVRAPGDEERHSWEMASIAANLHTFDPGDIAGLAEKAGFDDVTVDTAAWAWVLALGLNYYLAGEIPSLNRNRLTRALAGAAVEAAAAFDRSIGDRLVPAGWRHTVQVVLR